MNIILIVDDNVMYIKYLSSILKSDYTLLIAKDGECALKLATKYSPDLIISDVDMPNMSGYELLLLLKDSEETGKIPLVFLSSLDSPDDSKEGLRLGPWIIFTKPQGLKSLNHVYKI